MCVFITSTGWLCKLAFTVLSVCVLQAIGSVYSLDTGILGSPVPLTTSHPPACAEIEASVFPSDGVGAVPTSWSIVTFINASLSTPSHPQFTQNHVKKAKGQCASHLYKAECYAILFHISAQLLTWNTDKLNKILLYCVTNTNTATLNSSHAAEYKNVSKAHYHNAEVFRVVVKMLLFNCVLGCISQKQLCSQFPSLPTVHWNLLRCSGHLWRCCYAMVFHEVSGDAMHLLRCCGWLSRCCYSMQLKRCCD